jgi:hypothetical protein
MGCDMDAEDPRHPDLRATLPPYMQAAGEQKRVANAGQLTRDNVK